jgi:hypothetical protein
MIQRRRRTRTRQMRGLSGLPTAIRRTEGRRRFGEGDGERERDDSSKGVGETKGERIR